MEKMNMDNEGKPTVKRGIINNVLVVMSVYISSENLQILEMVLNDELLKVKMEEITTLPITYHNETDQRNQYIIQLFLIKKHLKEKTKESYLNAVKRLIILINKPLSDMDESDVAYYLHWYEHRNEHAGGKRNQATTINNERRFLSAFFTWMRREKLIRCNPVEAVEPRKEIKKPIDYFCPEDMSKLRDACRTPRERALVEVLRSTGARAGEVTDITLDQIDLTTGDIMILGEKSSKYRPIYLDDEARYYYMKYLASRDDDSPYMFPQSRKPYGKMTTGGIRSALQAIGKRSGVKCRIYPHKMRKTLGMHLKNKGVDIGTIQEIMGHASPAVTAQYYAQSTPKTLRYIRERAA